MYVDVILTSCHVEEKLELLKKIFTEIIYINYLHGDTKSEITEISGQNVKRIKKILLLEHSIPNECVQKKS